jgi:hypothetical protein
MDHFLPFQLSASVWVALLPANEPTAMHLFAEAHHTAARLLDVALGDGVGRSDHFCPFHRSPSVRSALPLLYWPTAVQALGDAQDAPESWLCVAPEGFGLRCTFHPEPAAAATVAIVSVSTTTPIKPTRFIEAP